MLIEKIFLQALDFCLRLLVCRSEAPGLLLLWEPGKKGDLVSVLLQYFGKGLRVKPSGHVSYRGKKKKPMATAGARGMATQLAFALQ